MLVMEIYTFTFKMVNKMKNPGSERVAGLIPPLISFYLSRYIYFVVKFSAYTTLLVSILVYTWMKLRLGRSVDSMC